MISVLGAGWNTAATLLAVLTPLVAVPLTVITFYLRSLREVQSSTRSETLHRIEGLEAAQEVLRRQTAQFERDYATKEEWIRETTTSRRSTERLREMMVRLETRMENTHDLARRLDVAGAAPLRLRDRTSPTTATRDLDESDPDATADEGSH